MTTFCAHPGCIHPLHAGNRSGVCRAHMHSPACRCAWCRAPRKLVKRKARRQRQRWHVRTRADLLAEGLLPGLHPDPDPQSVKGQP